MASQNAPVDVHAAAGLSSPAPGASGGASSSVTPPAHAGGHIAANPALISPTVITTSILGGIGGAAASGGSANVAVYPAAALSALETYKKKDNSKIVVRFKAIGNAPIMKNNYFRITAFNRFQAVIQFLRKELGWKAGDALFLYINSSFSPAPDDTVGNLFRCFGTEGHLIVNYSTQAAWG